MDLCCIKNLAFGVWTLGEVAVRPRPRRNLLTVVDSRIWILGEV
jgi:hypothetical protein